MNLGSSVFADGPLPAVHVAEYTPRVSGCLQGFLVIGLEPGVLIHGVAVFNKDGQRWVKLPQREYKDGRGETRYARVISFASSNMERAFQRAVLADLDRYLQENGDGE